jgi:hypothetical protein
MPALDTSASGVALGQLENLPFGNIIAAPINAAINAQALAAQTTIDFIRAIGLQEVNGKLEAVNVAFTYRDGSGIVRELVIPALTIFPIPFIVIDTIDVQFKARIAASAQQSSEDRTETEAKAEVKASAAWGGKRFGASIEVNASYSAKKDSKASQESKYSVEYTMDVQVHASQSGLPQGMAQILNILQDGITNKPLVNQLQVFGLPGIIPIPASGTLSEDFTVIALNETGDPVGFTITVALAPTTVLTASAPGTSNPAKITLSKASGLDPTTLPQDVAITVTATPTTTGDPVVESRTVKVVAG